MKEPNSALSFRRIPTRELPLPLTTLVTTITIPAHIPPATTFASPALDLETLSSIGHGHGHGPAIMSPIALKAEEGLDYLTSGSKSASDTKGSDWEVQPETGSRSATTPPVEVIDEKKDGLYLDLPAPYPRSSDAWQSTSDSDTRVQYSPGFDVRSTSCGPCALSG